MSKKFKYAKILGVITFTLILAFLLLNIEYVADIFSKIFAVLMPVIYGFIIAYILSFPYNFFQTKCFHKIGTKRKKMRKIQKPLSMLCAYILCFGILTFLICILVPELSKSISGLIQDIPKYAATIESKLVDFVNFVDTQFGYNLTDASTYNEIMNMLTGSNVQEFISKFISNFFPAALTTAKVFTTGLYNWIIGIIISIYMLGAKDKLCKQIRAMVVAYLPIKTSKRVIEITDLCNKKCGKFIIGKIIDSAIIGVICFIGLSIFRFDYALLISVVVGITNVIPFFGPFIGAIPCAFLLLLIDPLQCFWFIVFVIILQQFDGNFLGPKILGETVGISGFWILFSVLVGGGLFGIPGMLLGVPVFAVIYTLLDEGVTKRLAQKRALVSTEIDSHINDTVDTDIVEK